MSRAGGPARGALGPARAVAAMAMDASKHSHSVYLPACLPACLPVPACACPCLPRLPLPACLPHACLPVVGCCWLLLVVGRRASGPRIHSRPFGARLLRKNVRVARPSAHPPARVLSCPRSAALQPTSRLSPASPGSPGRPCLSSGPCLPCLPWPPPVCFGPERASKHRPCPCPFCSTSSGRP